MEESKYQPPIKLALLLLLIGVAVAIHQFKVPPIMVQIADSMGAGEEQGSGLMSVFMFVCLLFSLPVGSLVEKVSTKKVLLLSVSIIMTGSVIGALAPSFAILLFSRAVEGLGFLLMSVALPVAVVKYSDPKKVGLVMGIAVVWISMGAIVAFNTVPTLNQLFDWKGIWWIYTAFALVAFAIFAFGFKGKEVPRDQSEAGDSGSILAAFKNKDLLLGAFGFMVFNVNFQAMVTFFPIHSVRTGLFGLNKAAFMASLPMILSLIGSPAFGRWADKVGHKWLYSMAILCSGIGAFLMFAGTLSTVMAGALILGLVGTASPPLIFSSMGKIVPEQKLLAKSNSIVVLFQTLGMFLASFGFDKLALNLGGDYTKAGLFLLPLTVLGAVLILFINYDKAEAGA